MIAQEEILFRLSDVKRARLIDALSTPELQEAFSILGQVPSKEPAFVPGVPFDTTCAHELCRVAGANSVIKGLVRMTHPPKQSSEEKEDAGEEQPFEYLKQAIPEMPPIVSPSPSVTPDPAVRVKRKYIRKVQPE